MERDSSASEISGEDEEEFFDALSNSCKRASIKPILVVAASQQYHPNFNHLDQHEQQLTQHIITQQHNTPSLQSTRLVHGNEKARSESSESPPKHATRSTQPLQSQHFSTQTGAILHTTGVSSTRAPAPDECSDCDSRQPSAVDVAQQYSKKDCLYAVHSSPSKLSTSAVAHLLERLPDLRHTPLHVASLSNTLNPYARLEHEAHAALNTGSPRPSIFIDKVSSWPIDSPVQTIPDSRTTQASADMDDKDLFLEVADDADARSPDTLRDTPVRVKRRSLPPAELRALTAMETHRPRTSGGLATARPGSRLDEIRASMRYRQLDQGVQHGNYSSNMSHGGLPESITVRSRRGSRYSAAPERQPLSPPYRASGPRSPDMPTSARRGSLANKLRGTKQSTVPRLDSEGESPEESSEQKQSVLESLSAESQTAPSTVWDELDDLKSRIKKLELTGKLPPTSGAAMALDTSSQTERPRTATTAPTTIDSSPKRDKPRPAEDGHASDQLSMAPINTETHPLLHAALAKAKPLLNPSLYRSLEASAADALNLASLTGITTSTGSGPRSSSAASAVNGGTSLDRALRRKVDSMCRNLTELCLALCDGKHETSSLPATPMSQYNHHQNNTSSSGRLSRMSSGRPDIVQQTSGRPISRLEARRSSILGTGAEKAHSHGSPRGEADDASVVSEYESVPSQPSAFVRPRYSRSPSRSAATRSRFEDISGDEDPTIRVPSRVGSDFSFRSKRSLDTHHSPLPAPNRSFSLRESLTRRRGSGQGAEGQHRNLARVASTSSDAGRMRWTRESTPPVLEEDVGEQEVEVARSHPRQSRLPSLSQLRFGSKRAMTDGTSRDGRLGRTGRQVAVE